jgi:hypothetical protein
VQSDAVFYFNLSNVNHAEGNTISNPSTTLSINKQKRRIFESAGLNIKPYRKKPKMNDASLLAEDDPRKILPRDVVVRLDNALFTDTMWMIEVFSNENKTTPIWVGWNSLRDTQPIKQQKIWYLQQINESPTSNSVVIETMRRSLEIAKECNRESIAVTYDLAIAKIALQIQNEEKPAYDNLFIHLGSFHLEMAYLKLLAKSLGESGGPYILNECEVLAKGSISSVCKGLNYKRAKNVHQWLSLAMQNLHFESYVDLHRDSRDLLTKVGQQNFGNIQYEDSKEAKELFHGYLKFVDETTSGKHGKTAMFWMKYVQMVNEYHAFIRSIRSGDVQMFTAMLPEIADYFFALNHPNYARWTVRYHDNLLRL